MCGIGAEWCRYGMMYVSIKIKINPESHGHSRAMLNSGNNNLSIMAHAAKPSIFH
jgi:hypothetical protein